MRIKHYFLILIAFITWNHISFSQTNNAPNFYIDLPVFETPYNISTKYHSFSMHQSVRLTKNFYYASHYGIETASERWLGKNGKLWSRFIISVFDFAPITLSNTWLHEEGHRSIISLRGYSSRNFYWSNSVTNVNDNDLIELKMLHPTDMIREATAGNEINLEFVFALEKDKFFEQVNSWNYSLYWGNYLVNSFYLYGSAFNDKPLLKFKNGEDTDIHKRDVNGFDPINAVYDMFNPSENYQDRGIHPSGVGIDRYIEYKNLSSDAQKHIKTQFYLSLLNFLDPNLIGFNEFGKDIKWNVTLRHHMTPFGSMIGANIFLKNENWGLLISPQIFRNYSNTFASVDIEFRNNWAKFRIAGWQQPKDQLFFETEGQLGGFVGVSATMPTKMIRPYIEINIKSEGWVAGNPYLNGKITALLGLKWNPFTQKRSRKQHLK